MSDTKPTVKRKRVTQACDYCRKKKAKCDGAHPVCSSCKACGAICVYPVSKKRGLRTGYLNQLERRNALFQTILGGIVGLQTKDGITIESIITSFLDNEANKKELLDTHKEKQNVWHDSIIAKKFDKIVLEDDIVLRDSERLRSERAASVSLKEESEEPDIKKTRYSPTNEFDKGIQSKEDWKPDILQFHGLSGAVSGFSSETIQQYNETLPQSKVSPFRVASIFHVRSKNVKSIPKEMFSFPVDSRVLLDTYFQVIHTWLPMLNRVHLIRYIHRVAEINSKGSTDEHDLNTIALIWTVLANGRHLIDTGNSKPTTKTSSVYANYAIMALEYAGLSTIETIQAMLLLGYYEYSAGNWDHSWVLTSSAARMAIDVRLMNPNGDVYVGDMNIYRMIYDESARLRTWAVAFTLNTLLSARMGRSPVIRVLDWPQVTIDEEGWEEWESWNNTTDKSSEDESIYLESGRCLSTFNYLLRIMSVLNLSITSTIDIDGVEGFIFSPNVVTFDFLQSKLYDLMKDRPKHCVINDNISQEEIRSIPPFILFTYLAYHLALCITAVRFEKVEVEQGYKYTRLNRNKCYTLGVMGLKNMLTCLTTHTLMRIPYLDYLTTMCMSTPRMLIVDQNSIPLNEIRTLIEKTAKLSFSCRIARDVISISEKSRGNTNATPMMRAASDINPMSSDMANGMNFDFSSNTNASYESADSPMSSRMLKLTPQISDSVILPKTPIQQELFFTDKTSRLTDMPLHPTFEGNNKTPGLAKDDSIQDDLEAFMINSAANSMVPRHDQFLKNLGFVGGNSLKNTWNTKNLENI